MRRLTTRQRFALIFSIYFFILLCILYTIFFVVFNITSTLQLKKELLAESTDIINNHLIVSEKSLVFKKDIEGGTLKAYLITHNVSSAFFSSDGESIRTYGLFALDANDSRKSSLSKIINGLTGEEKYIEKTIPWGDQKLKTITIPLKSDGRVVGYLIIAKSLEDITSALRIMTMLFISLGTLTLIGSFSIGYLLIRWAFMPLRKMVRVIEKIEYDNLTTPLVEDGNPSDELTYLSKKFNEMLFRLNDMAERQKTFIANASHELKTPLARAISSLDLLYQDTPSNTKELRLVRDDLFEINNLIERLLLLTRLKKDIHMDKPRNLLILDFFERLKKRLEPQLINKQLNLIISSPEKVQLLIPKEYLSIIFSNILLNAIKYSFPNKNIYVTVQQLESETVISVKDEGIGMDKNDSERMFDRFFRGKGVSASGYGIGLSLVKQICDLYSIVIKSVSEKDKGTTIFFHFPS